MTQKKRYIPPPSYDELTSRWLSNYDQANYGTSLASRVLRATHSLIEQEFTPDHHFPSVLEIGAGTLFHLKFVRHRFAHYVASDLQQAPLHKAMHDEIPDNVSLAVVDGNILPFGDDTFDRLIATHVLEHVVNPHLVLAEWVRVLKPGGVLSLILPCDPGLLWRFGRYFGPRKSAEAHGLPYDYYMAREHVNSIFSLREILNFHFPEKKITWWPTRIANPDMNLIYAGNFYV